MTDIPVAPGSWDSQTRAETSPLAVAIVEALFPAPPTWPEECYGLVDALLEGTRERLRHLQHRVKELEAELADRGPKYPRDAIDI